MSKESRFEVFIGNNSNTFIPLDVDTFISEKSEKYIPNHVIGYYSGENKRIRELIKPYEDIIVQELKYSLTNNDNLRKILFIENNHAKLILITLLLYKLTPGDDKNLYKFIVDTFTSISKLSEINLKLKNPIWYNKRSKIHKRKGIDQLEENLMNNIEFPFWNIKGNANKLLNFFYNNNLPYPVYYLSDDLPKRECLELNQILIDEESIIADLFPRGMDFFNALESLLHIQSIENIALKVKSNNGGLYT
ncbi:hypothetical protein BWI97_26610 [Siphonobacter sp. BAB-5405]|uniref:hypothetical protein n=1 Tax=Siphonobacter sp. BAB-5405 TaxID=1864825 RepID=UPI000C80FF30|nr:hypothetical protein [Siphonobacter sp. BAB-5405]PMD85637.1 hypothetical protein BWI97_26610 [Siphonobacter sp. BAB-5405]